MARRAEGVGGAGGRRGWWRRSLEARRRAWVVVHRWLGLILAIQVALLGLSGSVLVLYEELDAWLEPGLHLAASGPGAPARPTGELVAAAEAAAPPGWTGWYLELPEAPGRNWIFALWYDPAAPDGTSSLSVPVDPATATAGPGRVFYHAWNPLRHALMGFFFKLHYALFLGDAGMLLVGALAVLLLVSTLSGLILWWPLDGAWRRVLAIRWRGGATRWTLDLHRAGGAVLALPLVVLVVTGLSFNLPDQVTWLVERFSPLTPPPAAPPAPPGPAVPAASLDRALQAALAAHPGGRLSRLSSGPPGSALLTACTRGAPGLPGAPLDERCLTVERATGAVLAVSDWHRDTGGDAYLRWQWPLHSGKGLGWGVRAIIFLAGLACPVLVLTGAWRWWRRARPNREGRARDGAGAGGASLQA